MNIQDLLKQAQQMQYEMNEVENELKDKRYEKIIGDGLIKVVVSGEMKLVELELHDDLLKEEKTEIQEMIMTVVNEVLTEAVADKENTMNELTAGIQLPGGF